MAHVVERGAPAPQATPSAELELRPPYLNAIVCGAGAPTSIPECYQVRSWSSALHSLATNIAFPYSDLLYSKVPMSSANNSIFPSPDILNEMECGKFVLANLAAKRAKQLKDGAPPLVVIDSKHPLSIALAEIAAGKIRPVFDVNPDDGFSTIDVSEADDQIGNELGILLPALDESEAELLGVAALVGEDVEEHEEGEEVASITDLLEEEPVAATADSEEETLSLSELAEKEESESEEDEPEA